MEDYNGRIRTDQTIKKEIERTGAQGTNQGIREVGSRILQKIASQKYVNSSRDDYEHAFVNEEAVVEFSNSRETVFQFANSIKKYC